MITLSVCTETHTHSHSQFQMDARNQPQSVTHMLKPTNSAIPDLSLCPPCSLPRPHPYPTGPLGRAASQADGAVDRGQLFPETFHLPLGSLSSLGRRGQHGREVSMATAEPTLHFHLSLHCLRQGLGRRTSEGLRSCHPSPGPCPGAMKTSHRALSGLGTRNSSL